MKSTISTAEAAQHLGVTPTRVQQLIYSGKLKAEKIGRDWRITPAAVGEYLRNSAKSAAFTGGS